MDAWRSPIEESAAAIKRYFDDHFARAPFVPVVDGEVTAPEMWPGLSVILQGGSLVGVFDEHALGHDLWRYGSFVAPLPSHGIRTGPPVSLRRSTDALPSIAGFAGRPEADQPPTASGADGLVSTPFIAHPRLTPESPAQAGQILHFRAGFADRPDADADEQRRIRIDDALPGETILVVVSADGAAIEGMRSPNWHWTCPTSIAFRRYWAKA